MTQLTIGTAQILANEYGLDIASVRSVHKDIFTDGIAIGDLFFKTGTTIPHARMVLDCIGKDDEVSVATVRFHTRRF